MNKDIDTFVWKKTEPDEPQMWCYAGGRRYLFANCILRVKLDKFYGAIYEINLDNIEKDLAKLDERDTAYVKSLDDDFEMARELADSIDCDQCDRETELFDTEEELWEHVKSIRG